MAKTPIGGQLFAHNSQSAPAWQRALKPLAAGLAGLGLVVTGGLLPAQAKTAPPAQPTSPTIAEVDPDGGVLRTQESQAVAPGVSLTNFSRLEDGGWNNGNLLSIDLTEPTVSLDVTNNGAVTKPGTLTEIMKRSPKAVAGINGTFFDMNYSNAPVYTSIGRDGVQTGTVDERPALTVDGARAAIQQLSAAGTMTYPDHGESSRGTTTLDLGGLNNPSLGKDKIGVYDTQWGDYPLSRPVGGPDAVTKTVAKAIVVAGKVSEVVSDAGSELGRVPEDKGTQVLLGREAGAKTVGALKPGDEVDITVAPKAKMDMGLAGSHQLLRNGKVTEEVESSADDLITSLHPRTAVGISKNGQKVFALTVDGKTAQSHGMSMPELADTLARMGAYNAVNLDGGGSTTMAARVAGASAPAVWNSSSDGSQRNDANALVVYSDAPTSALTSVRVDPTVKDEHAVFAGLTRSIQATGLNDDLGPMASQGTFAAGGKVAVSSTKDASAVVEGRARGTGTVTYTVGSRAPGRAASAAKGSLTLTVLGTPEALVPSTRALNLTADSPSGVLSLQGVDADGNRALIEPRDVKVKATKGITVKQGGAGDFSVSAKDDVDTGTVTLSVKTGKTTVDTNVAVTNGTESKAVFDLADASAFTDGTARASGSFEKVDVPDGQQPGGIRLRYDFTQSTATRGYYLIAKAPKPVEGTALGFDLWVKGDGSGVWPRLQVTDADGVTTNVDGANIDFEGWQKVHFTVPVGLSQPLTPTALRLMETKSDAKYQGDLTVAGLTATVTPEAKVDNPLPLHDRALLANGSVAERPQHIAVMSDAQFVAREPDSENAKGARRTLKQIAATKPDLLVINGDLVDEASEADFELAKKILDENWDANIPYIYVPGNHEVMGGAIDNFKAAFGATTQNRTVGGTRVITLDSSAGTLHANGTDQLRNLENQLEQVERDPNLTGALVFFHHPTQDPLPDKNSQLGDRREAEQLEKALGAFRARSHKSVAVVNGHVGVFNGSAANGVTYVVNGNSGKDPASTPARGGFTGWTMLGVDPEKGKLSDSPSTADRASWMAAETRPWVDSVALDAPGTIAKGDSVDVAASIEQDGRSVPVQWPVSAQWGGSGVTVDSGEVTDAGTAAEKAGTDVVRVNPLTHTMTALRAGTATLRVTVNGHTAEAVVTVPGDDEGSGNGSGGDSDSGAEGGSDGGDEGSGSDGSDDHEGSEGDAGSNGGGTGSGNPDGPGDSDGSTGSADGGDSGAQADGEDREDDGPGAVGRLPITGAGAGIAAIAVLACALASLGVLLVRRSRGRH